MACSTYQVPVCPVLCIPRCMTPQGVCTISLCCHAFAVFVSVATPGRECGGGRRPSCVVHRPSLCSRWGRRWYVCLTMFRLHVLHFHRDNWRCSRSVVCRVLLLFHNTRGHSSSEGAVLLRRIVYLWFAFPLLACISPGVQSLEPQGNSLERQQAAASERRAGLNKPPLVHAASSLELPPDRHRSPEQSESYFRVL